VAIDAATIARLSFLGAATEDIRARVAAQAIALDLPAGARVYAPGQAPEGFLIVLSGSVRVQQVSPQGREIVLYRVQDGESCTLTTACLLGYNDYPAEALAETPVRAVALPRGLFDTLIAQSPPFRRAVFTAVSTRITELFQLVEDVAFGRLDARLAQCLLRLAQGREVRATQQQLASEIGSAREVVSRLLTEFQRRGFVQVSRGIVSIADRAGLERIS
jgi:CRP/FNR family transcriptional regulator